MTWFAASIVIAVKPISETTEDILVHENIYLVEGVDSSEAMIKAERIGHEEASLNDGLTLNNLPAKRIFAGVRKLINVSNPPPLNMDMDRPTDGTEISYSVYKVKDDETLKQLAMGNEVNVQYLE